MKAQSLDDFSGGFVESEHPSAFGRGQWKKLDGFVVEGGQLRSQWPLLSFDVPGPTWEWRSHAGTFWHIDFSTGEVKNQHAPSRSSFQVLTGTWDDTESYDLSGTLIGPTTTLSDSLASASGFEARTPRILGAVSIPAGDDLDLDSALVVTDTTPLSPTTTEHVYLLGRASSGTRVSIEVPVSLPTTVGAGTIPFGNVVAQWGDFTIWGDIIWYNDPDAQTGRKFYQNGLWFSQPASFLDYDHQDVILLPHSGETPRVMDMIVLPEGMLVLCDKATYFLRGTADDFVIERLSVGPTSLVASGGADLLEPMQAAVWCDQLGRVWLSDGTEMRRLDDTIGASPGEGVLIADELSSASQSHRHAPTVTATGDTVVVAREPGDYLWCMHLLPDKKATWTRLDASPDQVNALPVRMVSDSDGLVHWVAEDPSGLMVNNEMLAFDVSANLGVDQPPALGRGRKHYWSGGARQESLLSQTIGTPVLTVGSGHDRAWWHRLGIRFGATEDEDALLTTVVQWTTGGDVSQRADGTFSHLLSSGDLDDGLAFGTSLHTKVVHRKHMIVPGIGPTRHYRAEFDLMGDVTVEGVTIWAEGASVDRGRRPEQAGNSEIV